MSWPYAYIDRNSTKLCGIGFIGYFKSKSTLMDFDRYAHMKYKYGNRKFWARGYFVDTVGKMKR